MNAPSKHLSRAQCRGIEKVGDSMITSDSKLPGFSASGCASQVDRILDYMPAQDVKDLKMLLGIFGILPGFVVRLIISFLEWAPHFPTLFGGGLLRLIRLGLRGLIMSLYYGDKTVLHSIGYDVKVYTGDLK